MSRSYLRLPVRVHVVFPQNRNQVRPGHLHWGVCELSQGYMGRSFAGESPVVPTERRCRDQYAAGVSNSGPALTIIGDLRDAKMKIM